jgi:hypothetical protein
MGFVLFEEEGLLFFSLGIWMQKTNFPIEKPGRWFRPLWWGVTFIVLAALKTWLAFEGQKLLGMAIFPVLTILHKSVVFTGLVACWFGLDKLVSYFMNRGWFVWLSAFAFMIYAMHAPLVAYLINPALTLLNLLPGSQILAFVFLPITIISFAIITGALLRRISPAVYSLLTGGRGI